MKNLSNCLKEASDGYISSNEESLRLKGLLDWVAQACNDIYDDFGWC